MHPINKLLSCFGLALVKRYRLRRHAPAPTLQPVLTKPEGSGKKIRIAVDLRSNGLGDALISLSWLQQLYRQMPEAILIDLYGREAVLDFLTNMQEQVHKVFTGKLFDKASGYDLKLRIHYRPVVVSYCPERLADNSSFLLKTIDRITLFNKHYQGYLAGNQIAKTVAWTALCKLQGWTRWSSLGACGSIPFDRSAKTTFHLSLEALPILERLQLEGRPYITIHRGIDTDHKARRSGSSSWVKVIPKANAEDFCKLFKKHYPDITIVQVGKDEELSLDGVDVDAVNKTSLHELAVVLKHALVHVDGESGLVHLHRALGGNSVVLFGPTPHELFAYPENHNLVSPYCNGCMWMTGTSNWINHCLRGHDSARCLEAISADAIFNAADTILKSKKNYSYTVCDLRLYSSRQREDFLPSLEKMCRSCSVERQPISQHIYGQCRTYIHATKQWEYPYAIEQLANLPVPAKIADIGSGRGMLSWYLAKRGHDVTSYDINYLWDARKEKNIEHRYMRFGHSNGFSVDFGSVFNIPAADDFFDAVTCISVVEHVPYKRYALKEMLRVLKPGGKLIITYDLVLDSEIERGSQRVEVYLPEILTENLREIGVQPVRRFSVEEVQASMRDILNDQVKISATEITVGGLVLQKTLG